MDDKTDGETMEDFIGNRKVVKLVHRVLPHRLRRKQLMDNEAEPLTECERCRHWLPHECDLAERWWPDFGEMCDSYEREPGADDEK